MPQCSYTNNEFNVSSDIGFRCNNSNQCWVPEVKNYGSINEPRYSCIFHAPRDTDLHSEKDTSGELLKSLLDEWNKLNNIFKESSTSLLKFILPEIVCGDLDLRKYNFSHDLILSSAKFKGSAQFYLSKFDGLTIFSDAVFEEGAYFHSSTFNDDALFSRANFNNVAMFQSSTFEKIITFHHATFNDYSYFGNSKFKEGADFAYSKFHSDCTFENSTFFGGSTSFTCTEFIFMNNFKNVSFESTTYFRESEFSKFPDFHGAKLHQSTDFRGANFFDVDSRQAAPAYRTLKLAMGDVRSRVEESDFFALEMESIKNQFDTPISIKIISNLYKTFSDYGRSLTRPIWWLTAVNLFYFLFYLLAFSTNYILITIQFTIMQVVRPFSAWSRASIDVKGLISQDLFLLVQIVATTQSLLSISLITLFVLAIRRYFKLN